MSRPHSNMEALQARSINFIHPKEGGSLHQSCPVLRGGRLRSQLWRDYYWHETCIRVSVPLVRLTGLDGDPTNPTFSKQSQISSAFETSYVKSRGQLPNQFACSPLHTRLVQHGSLIGWGFAQSKANNWLSDLYHRHPAFNVLGLRQQHKDLLFSQLLAWWDEIPYDSWTDSPHLPLIRFMDEQEFPLSSFFAFQSKVL